MSPQSIRVAAFGIGAVAGLRSLLAPAALAWGARKDFIPRKLPVAMLVSTPVSKKLMKLAAGELLADKLPFTPRRISPGPLAARIASGAACGAAVSFIGKQSPKEGALLGVAGALAGAFAGYYARRSFSRKHPDIMVALVEDAIAIAAAYGIVRQLRQSI